MGVQQQLIQAGGVNLEGELELPRNPVGVVVFAHGSGSSRFSPRNRFVARTLREAGLGTLLFDLLTPEDEQIDLITGRLRFDIDLLATRLVAVTRWLKREPRAEGLPLGYFGSSTGGGAALVAAAKLGEGIRAVVSRGGRPDLAFDWLTKVKSPTLLLVGKLDSVVIDLNQKALNQMTCPCELIIIPNATHLFEEPGTLEFVAHEAAAWFNRHFTKV